MANRKGAPIGSRRTNRQKPDIQRRGPDHDRWAGTRERAGPKANRFQKIKGLTISLFSPHLCKLFSAQ